MKVILSKQDRDKLIHIWWIIANKAPPGLANNRFYLLKVLNKNGRMLGCGEGINESYFHVFGKNVGEPLLHNHRNDRHTRIYVFNSFDARQSWGKEVLELKQQLRGTMFPGRNVGRSRNVTKIHFNCERFKAAQEKVEIFCCKWGGLLALPIDLQRDVHFYQKQLNFPMTMPPVSYNNQLDKRIISAWNRAAAKTFLKKWVPQNCAQTEQQGVQFDKPIITDEESTQEEESL